MKQFTPWNSLAEQGSTISKWRRRRRNWFITFDTTFLFHMLLTTKEWHLPSGSTRINHLPLYFLILRGVQSGDQKWGTLCSEKNWQNRPSDRYFQEKILGAQFLAPSHIQKSTKIINGDTYLLLVTSSNPLPKRVLDCTYPPSLKSQITLTSPPTSWEQFLSAERLSPQAFCPK